MNERHHRRRPGLGAWTAAMAIAGCLCVPVALCATAGTIILLIGDGMGSEQVKAARCYLGSNLCFEAWERQGQVQTHSANSSVTDSAAAGTALATGHKANNGVVSVAFPGDGREYETVLEYLGRKGRRTGLVTTTVMVDATPAAFGAHEASRSSYAAIAADYLGQSRPNVLLGGGAYGMSASAAVAAGYTVVTDRAGMQALEPETVSRVSGQFGSGHLPYEHDGVGSLPHLSEMTRTALEILDGSTNGFFLMVEGGRIDHACHANNITNCVFETVEFNRAVQTVIDWASNRTDTLMIVTADHECGGLTVVTNNGAGQLPNVTWSSGGHTGTDVGIYARGPGAEEVAGVIDNTDVYRVMMRSQSIVPEAVGVGRTAGGVHTDWNARPGATCRLDATGSLVVTNWVPVVTVTADTHEVRIDDTNAPAPARRFYRLAVTL